MKTLILQSTASVQDFDPHILSYYVFVFLVWNNSSYTYTVSYRPNIPVELVTTLLGFPTPDAWYDFSKELPIVYSDDSKAQIDCKANTANLGAWWMRRLFSASVQFSSFDLSEPHLKTSFSLPPWKPAKNFVGSSQNIFGYRWDVNTFHVLKLVHFHLNWSDVGVERKSGL